MFSVSSSNFTGFRFFKKIKESSSFFKTQQGVNVSHPRFCYNFSINSSRINTAQELLREVYTSSSLNDRYTKKTIEKDSFRSMDNILFIELALSRFREKSTYKKKFFFYFFRSLGEFHRDPAFCYNFKNLKMLQKIFYLFDSKKKKSLLDFKNINGTNAAIRYLSLRKQTNYLNTDRIKSSNLSLDMQLFSKFCNYFVKILKMSSFLKALKVNSLRKEPMVDVLESFYLGINNWFSTTTVKDFSFIKNNSFFFKKKEFPIASSRYEHTNHNIVNVFFLNLFLIFNENKYILYSKKKKSYNSFIFSRDFQNDTIFQSL